MVSYVQRRIFVDELTGNRHSATGSQIAYGDELHDLLFHPIAGDSVPMGNHETLCMKRIQFGLLDMETTLDLSVAQNQMHAFFLYA